METKYPIVKQVQALCRKAEFCERIHGSVTRRILKAERALRQVLKAKTLDDAKCIADQVLNDFLHMRAGESAEKRVLAEGEREDDKTALGA